MMAYEACILLAKIACAGVGYPTGRNCQLKKYGAMRQRTARSQFGGSIRLFLSNQYRGDVTGVRLDIAHVQRHGLPASLHNDAERRASGAYSNDYPRPGFKPSATL
jgi:hypothetical protein